MPHGPTPLRPAGRAAAGSGSVVPGSGVPRGAAPGLRQDRRACRRPWGSPAPPRIIRAWRASGVPRARAAPSQAPWA